jgi:hypothetical protein
MTEGKCDSFGFAADYFVSKSGGEVSTGLALFFASLHFQS